MFSKTLKSIFLAFMLLMATVTTSHAQTLQDVIDKYCRVDCVSAERLTSAAKRAAHGYKIDYHAIMAIVHIESKYHIKAKNGSSVGLTQVHLKYHRPKFRGKNVFDVDDNMFAGMLVFRECLNRTKGSYPLAFSCYNGGGDSKYRSKAMKALDMMRSLDHPKVSQDPLGDFIDSKGHV